MKRFIYTLAILLVTSLAYAGEPDHSIWNGLLQEHVSSSGKVDYKGMKMDIAKLDSYLAQYAENGVGSDWGKAQKKAYYINAYNAYCIKFVLMKYPVSSVNDISFSGKEIWDYRGVKLGDKTITLRYLENDILRRMKDPRIHFAINCASYSCPKLWNKAYTKDNVNSQMTAMAKSFVNDAKKNVISAKKVGLSKIFDWYKEDFVKEDQTLIDYINKYSNVTVSPKAKIEYLPYNWSLNEQ